MLDRRVAIVTGGARGIGRGCAHALAGKGHAVVLVDVLVPEMESTRGEIEALGVPCSIHEADVADHGRARAVVRQVQSDWGRIDVLVNNAGRSAPVGILEITEDQWDAAIDVNLKSCFNYIQAVAPLMIEREYGRIVSMSSLNAHSGGVTAAVSRFAYAAAKAGIIAMTMGAAQLLDKYGITCNVIMPRALTDMTAGGQTAEMFAPPEDGSFHMFDPANVAPLVGYLASMT